MSFSSAGLLYHLSQVRSSLLCLAIASPMVFSQTVLYANEESAGATEQGEFIGAVETVYPDWFKVSFMELQEDVAEAAEEGKRLMLVFHQNGCPYCNIFVERNLSQKDIEDTLKTKFDVIELNMWGDREVVSVGGETYSEKAFAQALNVQFTPTVLFLNEQGQLTLRLNGYYEPHRFRLALDYVSNKMEEKFTFTEFLASRNSPPASTSMIERDYFTGPLDELSKRPGEGSKPLIVFFEQGGCKNCETLHDSILSKAESQDLLAQFDVYQVDMWGRDNFKTPSGEDTNGREWSKTLDVSYAPTMIVYAADGTEVIRSESYFKTFHTQSILDYVASDAWREQASFQRYLSARADALREQGEDVNIWESENGASEN